jgi:hypothetical protein
MFEVLIYLNKTGSHIDGPCSLPDTKLESGEEQSYLLKGIVSQDQEYVLMIPVCRRDIFILTKDGFNFLKCCILF